LGDPAPNEVGLCWRAWPCEACRGDVTAISLLLGSRAASPAVLEGSIEELIAFEREAIVNWVVGCPHTEFSSSVARYLTAGSEHLVYYDEGSANVWKATKPGLFGENYFVSEGKVTQKNCSPLNYKGTRPSQDRCHVGLGDARSDNFVQTSRGIVPIDIRLWASSY
jgi:hypothetical protein